MLLFNNSKGWVNLAGVDAGLEHFVVHGGSLDQRDDKVLCDDRRAETEEVL